MCERDFPNLIGETLSIMSASKIICRALFSPHRVSMWMGLCVVLCVASTSTCATASMMSEVESMTSTQIAESIDQMSKSYATFPESIFVDFSAFGAGCGEAKAPDCPSVPCIPSTPSKHLASELQFIATGINTSSSSSSTGSTGCPASGESSSCAVALYECVSELPPSVLAEWPRPGDVLDIPLAAPSEMLRPPQILADLA